MISPITLDALRALDAIARRRNFAAAADEAQCRGVGVGYLPRHRITRQVAEGGLQLFTLNVRRPPVEISLAWSRANMGRSLK